MAVLDFGFEVRIVFTLNEVRADWREEEVFLVMLAYREHAVLANGELHLETRADERTTDCRATVRRNRLNRWQNLHIAGAAARSDVAIGLRDEGDANHLRVLLDAVNRLGHLHLSDAVHDFALIRGRRAFNVHRLHRDDAADEDGVGLQQAILIADVTRHDRHAIGSLDLNGLNLHLSGLDLGGLGLNPE